LQQQPTHQGAAVCQSSRVFFLQASKQGKKNIALLARKGPTVRVARGEAVSGPPAPALAVSTNPTNSVRSLYVCRYSKRTAAIQLIRSNPAMREA